jgi:hypothetical protein
MYRQAAIQQLYAFWNTDSNNNRNLLDGSVLRKKFQTKLKHEQLLFIIIYFLHIFLLHVSILRIIIQETFINITKSGPNQNFYNTRYRNNTAYLVNYEY